jgi:hypothetical protein
VSNTAATLAALGRRREACDACIAAAGMDPSFSRPRARLGALAATPDGFADALASALAAVDADPEWCVCVLRACACVCR